MKQIMKLLAVGTLCCALAVPMNVNAKTYDIGETDMQINIDDSVWYVFTRDNIQNNPEVEELGLTYDYVYSVLHDNEMYLDGILFYEDGNSIELFVRKRANDEIKNLSNYSEKDVKEFTEIMAEKANATEYDVFQSDYKYAYLEYEQAGFYINEYVTVVNGDIYAMTFQATSEFGDEEYDEMERIVESVQFDVDTSLKEKNLGNSAGESILYSAMKGAAIGGIAGGVGMLIKKKSKKNQLMQDDTEE